MMPMAKRLPIALVPEGHRVPTVRNDVVDVCRRDVPAFLQTLHAEGVFFQVSLPGTLPLGAVASFAG